jgi:hypothetical protein
MSKTWQTPQWKKNVENFLNLHPFCEWCGKPSTVVHHPKRKNGYSDKEYISLVGCIPLCQSCHYAVLKKLKLCPVCKQNYFKPSRKKHKESCYQCFIKTPFGKAVNEYYQKQREAKS